MTKFFEYFKRFCRFDHESFRRGAPCARATEALQLIAPAKKSWQRFAAFFGLECGLSRAAAAAVQRQWKARRRAAAAAAEGQATEGRLRHAPELGQCLPTRKVRGGLTGWARLVVAERLPRRLCTPLASSSASRWSCSSLSTIDSVGAFLPRLAPLCGPSGAHVVPTRSPGRHPRGLPASRGVLVRSVRRFTSFGRSKYVCWTRKVGRGRGGSPGDAWDLRFYRRTPLYNRKLDM
mgnify:CR=1 FL=1